VKAKRTALPVFGMLLFIGGAPLNAAEVQLDWTGTLQDVFLTGNGVYSSTAVADQEFSGSFTYDITGISDSFDDGFVADYYLDNGSFGVTDGTTAVNGDLVTVEVFNDWTCGVSLYFTCASLTDIFGETITETVEMDGWALYGDVDFFTVVIDYDSLNTDIFLPGDTAIRALPPWTLPSGADDKELFWLFDYDSEGNLTFGAWGTLDTVQVVPVPAAIWLFGSALGLMGWMRRKF
jgi:hypothetical protein